MAPPATVQQDALLKILLHAAKYPHFGVNGILLGKPASKAGQADGRARITVVDAIPVIHNYTTLTPMFEAALFQVRSIIRSSRGGTGMETWWKDGIMASDARDVDTSVPFGIMGRAWQRRSR